MKRYSKLLTLLVAVGLLAAACREYKFPDQPVAAGQPGGATVSRGNADFSSYIAVGTSLSAGFMDGALYLNGQQNSFPSILAGQFALAGGGTFNQPLMPLGSDGRDLGVGISGTSFTGRLQLLTTLPAPVFVAPVPSTPSITPLSANWRTSLTDAQRQGLNNWGVPGITLPQVLIPGFGATGGNPYFGRMAKTPGTLGVSGSTVLSDALSLNPSPTFFTLELGANDVLGYALAGGTAPFTATTGGTTTNPSFDQAFPAVLTTMLSGSTSRRGIVANAPDVTTIPYVNVVPPVGYPPAPTPAFDAATVAGLNQLWGLYLLLLNNPATNPTIFNAGNGTSTLPPGYTPNPNNIPGGPLTPNPSAFNAFTAGRNNGVMAVETANAGTLPTATSAGVAPSGNQVLMTTSADRLLLTAQSGPGSLAPGTPNVTGGITPPLSPTPIQGQPNLIPIFQASGNAQLIGLAAQLQAAGITQLYFVPGAGPIYSQYVLDQNEFAFCRALTSSFNTIIQNTVNSVNAGGTRVGLFDLNGFLNQVVTEGVRVSPATSPSQSYVLTGSYPLGGFFSLDGVHPTPAGYAASVNAMIAGRNLRSNSEGINFVFGSTLPLVDVRQYRSTVPNF